MESLTASLLEWYDRVQRDLPWRADKEPYHIWVSEVMLQQTRVETVIPYYKKFLQRFPDMASLAAASEEELLETWQGLGYYSRVRHLQRGVREVLSSYGGKTPETRAELLKIPGIGNYTAGAILSIAHDQPEPAVDANVLRVVSRMLHVEKPMELSEPRRSVEVFVRGLLESSMRRGDITQALMELGALVCIPRNPRCGLCPWSDRCIAFECRDQNELPKKATPKPPVPVEVYTGILMARGKVLGVRRPAGGILGGMWEFPSVEKMTAEPTGTDPSALLTACFRNLGQDIVVGSEWRSLTHTFSHREWRMRVFFCNVAVEDYPPPLEALWLAPQEMDKVVWAGPHRKIALWVKAELSRDQERRF